MARNKYPEQTEARILETATRLFLEKGYRDTSIQDIVDELGGMTRGAFYHHFKSKEDVFDAVTTRLYRQDGLPPPLDQLEGSTGLEKLRSIVLRSLRSKVQPQVLRIAPEFWRSDKFVSMHLRETVEQIAPSIASIFEEGMADGSLPVRHAKEAAEVMLLLVNIWLSPVIFDADEEEYRRRVDIYGQALEGMGNPLMDQEVRAAFHMFFTAIRPKEVSL